MATMPSDYTEFPSEIILKPLALIGLSGLDAVNNAVHKEIWDAFSNNRRADRTPVRFKLLNNTFEFPVVKPKRNSYEWYIPKGVLKKNWIHKRVSLIPAVVVIFYDMDWNDPQWNEKIIECASKVQSIRAAVEGHATRVAVVVIQSRLSPPPSEYMLGAERAQALCAACEIQSKSLFVLPHSDHLMGYIVRLENAFYDIAQNYYHHETKNIKQHRDHLNKTTHQYLFVRHQFKLGYLNELKQDLSTAHKHYMHAYNNLLETRIVDTNTHEVRTVAGYINYKLCKLLFALNLPRDAIAQLKSHIERYKNRIGSTELLFEHYAWIARQYSAFGELFDEAIRAGLPAIQSQHPGFYYQHAAQFTVKRRQAMRSVCTEATAYPPTPDPLEGIVEFYGQRPWRPGRLSADPHDPQKEQAAVLALQYNERVFNHSAMIISFLGCAISQFKTFHSPRMRKQLVVEMANEYFYSADYGKALTLLTHMLWDYRREKWWFLASHVLNQALQCAYLSGKIQDYLQLSIEALSKHIQVPNNDKDRIFRNIMSVLNLNIPAAEPDLPASSQHKALELWQAAIEKEPLTVPVDMANISSFLEVKPKFKQQRYRMDEIIDLELYVRLLYTTVLEARNAFVAISSHTETIEIPITDDGNTTISLQGGKVKRFLCQFKPNPHDSGSDLHIKNVSFVLDTDRKRKIVLNFKIEGNKATESTIHPELLHFIRSPKADYEFDCIVPVTVASITSRECKVSLLVTNSSPALQGEWFPSTFTITNNEDSAIYDVKITLSLLSSPDNPNPDSVTELSLKEGEPQTQPLNIQVGRISPLGSHVNTFYLKTNRTATTTVQIKVTYVIDLPEISKLECIKEFSTKITVIKPFEVSTNFVAMNFKLIAKCFVDDPFIVMPQIKILSPWDLLIVNTELEVVECFRNSDTIKPSSCISNLEVAEKNVASDAVCIQAKYKPKDNPTRVGLYNITWRRKSNTSHCVMSSTALSGLPIDDCPIAIKVNYPQVVELLTSVPLKCTLFGKCSTPIRLSVTVEGTDAYMFSGYKKISVTIPPKGKVELCYNIHPLVAGNTTPPRLKATIVGDVAKQEVVSEMFDKIFPQNIFVMPKYNK